MEKGQIRKQIWDLMEERDIEWFPRPVHGRIPNFEGAAQAAERLKELPAWQEAGVVKANPDSPQIPMLRHDFPLDYIITPELIIKTRHRYPKPAGIYWDELTGVKIQAIPLLRRFQEQKQT